MPTDQRVSAWELRKHLLRQVRKMRSLYKVMIAIFCVMCLAILGHVIFYYNYLTDLRFNVLTEQGKIASAVQYRKNLLPVIIESVTSFVEHEDNVFNHTVDARERELKPQKSLPEKLKEASSMPMQDMLQRIMAIGEQYPSIRTSEAFQLLMSQVADAESKILDHRTAYNDAVNIYTTAMSMFPGNIYAYVFEFPSYGYFMDRSESEWPKSELLKIEHVRRNLRKTL